MHRIQTRAVDGRTVSRRSLRTGLAALTSSVIVTQSLPHQAAAEATSRPLFGAWVPGAPFDGSSASTANLDALEAALGAPLDVIHWFRGWAEAAPPPIDLLRLVASRGATPFLTWEPWDYTLPVSEQSRFALKRIAAGDYDEYIDTWAHGLAAYRAPVVLRFAHEMNGRAYPWCVEVPGNTSKDYVAAWRHVVGRFRGAGAMNVRFLWCPNVDWSGSGRPALANLYPGDEWTDLVGLDGYNGGRDLDLGWLAVLREHLQRVDRRALKPVRTRHLDRRDRVRRGRRQQAAVDRRDVGLPGYA